MSHYPELAIIFRVFKSYNIGNQTKKNTIFMVASQGVVTQLKLRENIAFIAVKNK